MRRSLRAVLLGAAVALVFSGGIAHAQLADGTTKVVGIFSGANTTTAVATLPAAAAGSGKTTYICSLQISGLGATAASGQPVTVATLTGGITATYYYGFVAGAALSNPPLIVGYSPCIPASAPAAGIVVTATGAAGNTQTSIVVTGYQY